jgi:ankyrin repeat protein
MKKNLNNWRMFYLFLFLFNIILFFTRLNRTNQQNSEISALRAELATFAMTGRKGDPCTVALHMAAESGRINSLKQVLDQGVNVNAQDTEGVTALMIASVLGHKEAVEFLIANGAEINTKGKNGITALFAASYMGHFAVVELLLDRGASDLKALPIAVRAGHNKIVTLFLDKGIANANTKTDEGLPILHIAAGRLGRKDMVRLLLARGADINAKDKNGDTARIFAEKEGRTEMARFLKRFEK